MTLYTRSTHAATAGILSHACFFIRGEHHIHAPIIARIYAVLLVGLCLLEFCLDDGNLPNAILSTTRTLVIYTISLLTSQSVYRLYFHRLRAFPGPLLARLTKFYHLVHVSNLNQYLFLEGLHQKYGDYVRTGPGEITIFNPEAISAVLGSGTRCSKSAWWDMMLPEVSMVTTRSKKLHAFRRRIWEGAFTVRCESKQFWSTCFMIETPKPSVLSDTGQCHSSPKPRATGICSRPTS